MTRRFSRLEKTFHRLQAQLACLDFAFRDIAGRAGIIAELGLGLGRTFDHVRRSLPDRAVYVFDLVDKAYADCRPAPEFFAEGDIAETFPAFLRTNPGPIILANCDLGSFDRASNARIAAMVSALVPPAIMPGGLIMSDLPLDPALCTVLPLPDGAMEGCYYLYRRTG